MCCGALLRTVVRPCTPKRFVVTAPDFTDVPRFPAGFELAEVLTAAARELHATVTPNGTLRTAVKLAVTLVPGAEQAGISVVERGNQRRVLAWTDEAVRTAESRPGGR
ncbi:antitermination regulator, partial [Streptomyces sp. TRM76130]|nr:antitermination regulator [Streptomyces sp. TRM76130]